MAKTRRAYVGAPASTTIASGINATATSITITANTGWYGSSDKPFYVVVSPTLAAEEKILVTISGTTLSVVGGVSGRGQDGTSAATHDSGATIFPVPTAIDFDEANELTAKYISEGSIVYQGASTFTERTIGTANQVLKVNSGATAPEWGQVATAGIADSAVTSAKIADGTIVAGDIADGAITSAKILDGTIATGDLADSAVTSAKIADGTIVAGDLADGAVTSAKILDGTIVNADINASAAIALSKLATGALPTDITVASANIVNGTIVDADISGTAAIALSKLATGTLPSSITVTTSNIEVGTIVNSDISTAAYISPNKIASHGNYRTRTTAQSISNGSWQKVAFGVEVEKEGTQVDYNTGTDNLVLDGYGTYVISAGLTFAADGTGVRGIRIYDITNSEVLAEMVIGAYGIFDCSINCSIAYTNKTSSHPIAVYAYQNSGGALNVKGERGTFVAAVKVAGAIA
jgi:hypothetical protein